MTSNPRRSDSFWLLMLALATFLALLFGSLNWLQTAILFPPARPGMMYGEAFTRWLSWAALAPLVAVLVRRWPLERATLARRLPLHVGAAILFAAVHSLLMACVYGAFHLYPKTFSDALGRLLMNFAAVNFVLYWAISGAFHAVRYHRELVQREQLAAALRASLTEARLDGLRAQLNPHFLFNTLNAISALALTGERERVVQTLSDLSDLLRVSLDRTLPQEIPLARELELLERYVAIQRTRFGDRLTFVLDVDDAARAALVPSMLLQPLVENALQHGLASLPGPGHVVVRARRTRDDLTVRVEDSGPGFNGNAAGSTNGIGLSNTRARLEQLHGDRQRCTCGDLPGSGGFVEVTVPFRAADAASGAGVRA
jgi:sensor histidine kinase YesM